MCASNPIYNENGFYAGGINVVLDISDRKKAEQKQEDLNRILEKKVKERTCELENVNTALKVLLKKRENDQKEIEDKIYQNFELLILPFFRKLKDSSSISDMNNIIGILESNLMEIVSPFSKKLSDPLIKMTPTEIQIASLIKQGQSNKEISKSLHISVRTVANHRHNIRNKLGLVSQKINLRTYLSSI